MKVLHLMRHGKSSWEGEGVSDIDRPLLERGIRTGYTMGARFLKLFTTPDLIVSSSANRALHTALIIAREVAYPVEKVKITDDLYNADMDAILHLILITDPSVNSLFIVGHNPGFTDVANLFMEPRIDNMDTSAMVSIEFQCDDWSVIQTSKCKAVSYSPKRE